MTWRQGWTDIWQDCCWVHEIFSGTWQCICRWFLCEVNLRLTLKWNLLSDSIYTLQYHIINWSRIWLVLLVVLVSFYLQGGESLLDRGKEFFSVGFFRRLLWFWFVPISEKIWWLVISFISILIFFTWLLFFRGWGFLFFFWWFAQWFRSFDFFFLFLWLFFHHFFGVGFHATHLFSQMFYFHLNDFFFALCLH